MAATHTPNLNLNKPDRQDYVSVVTDINDNMDKIDEVVKQAQDDIEAIEDWKPSGSGTLDQILRSNGDGTTRWDDAATQQEIGSAVTTWLGNNVPTGTTVVVDKSLSVENAAAEAQTVGNELSDLKSAFRYGELSSCSRARDGTITEIYTDGTKKVTTIVRNVITEVHKLANDTVVKTVTTTINGYSLSVSYS